MTCMKAQSQITAFINDKLEIDELDEFTKHIQSCDECKEELEVYYALLTAMKQLDEDRDLSIDFNQELKEKIDRAQVKIIHLRYNFYRKKGVLLMIIISMAAFFNLYQYFRQKDIENLVKESRFRLRSSFMEDRFDEPTQELNRYLKELREKAVKTLE